MRAEDTVQRLAAQALKEVGELRHGVLVAAETARLTLEQAEGLTEPGQVAALAVEALRRVGRMLEELK